MSRKNPYLIMGNQVHGSTSQGFTIEIKQYKSTVSSAYQADAKAMLNELQQDVDRLRRLSNIKSNKLHSKLA